MAELKENQLIFTDDEGKENICDILFTYESEEFKKSYVFFTKAEPEEDEEIQVSCAAYIPNDDGTGELVEVESDEEWEMLEKVFNDFAQADDEEDPCEFCEDCGSCEGCSGCSGCEEK